MLMSTEDSFYRADSNGLYKLAIAAVQGEILPQNLGTMCKKVKIKSQSLDGL